MSALPHPDAVQFGEVRHVERDEHACLISRQASCDSSDKPRRSASGVLTALKPAFRKEAMKSELPRLDAMTQKVHEVHGESDSLPESRIRFEVQCR